MCIYFLKTVIFCPLFFVFCKKSPLEYFTYLRGGGRAGEPESEPGCFGSLEPEPLEKKPESLKNLVGFGKKSGADAGAAKKISRLPSPGGGGGVKPVSKFLTHFFNRGLP